jgi:hypothetical protein
MNGRHSAKLEIGYFRGAGGNDKAASLGNSCGAGEKSDGINYIEEWVLGGRERLRAAVHDDVFGSDS